MTWPPISPRVLAGIGRSHDRAWPAGFAALLWLAVALDVRRKPASAGELKEGLARA